MHRLDDKIYYELPVAALDREMLWVTQIERTQAMPGTTSTGENIIDVEREEEMTPHERKLRRMEAVERYLDKEIANLPKGWTHASGKHFCVISHADKKFTKRILDHAENVRAYLEKTFPGLGDDYVPRGIIRIFKDDADTAVPRIDSWIPWIPRTSTIPGARHGSTRVSTTGPTRGISWSRTSPRTEAGFAFPTLSSRRRQGSGSDSASGTTSSLSCGSEAGPRAR